MGKHLVEEQISRKVDPNTGEITELSTRKTVVKKDPEPFFMTYSKQIIALYQTDILNVTTKILWKFLEFAEFNTGKVYIDGERAEEIKRTCNVSKASYYRAVNELIDMGIVSKGRGSYIINENMFWKGDVKMRQQVIDARLKISFSPMFPEDYSILEKKEEKEEE